MFVFCACADAHVQYIALLFRSKEIVKIVGNKYALLFRSKEIGKKLIVGNVNKRLMYCMIMSLKRITSLVDYRGEQINT